MTDSETVAIIRPLFVKLEERLNLNPILGRMFTSGLLDYYHFLELQSLNNRIQQNRHYLLYLLNQPVQQIRTLISILQEDIGNAAHQVLAKEILAMIPPDPMEVVTGMADAIPMDF